VLIAANQDTVFRRLTQAMGHPELADDVRYATHGARGERQVELDELISQWTRGLDVAEIEKLLESHGVPCGQIFRAPEMLADEHYRARQSIVEVAHHRLGSVAMQNVVPRLTRSPGSVRWVGPTLGAHTEEVLMGELGMTADELARLREAGVA
jgi:formyl-CoA transferase